MKKILSLFLAAAFVFAFAGCKQPESAVVVKYYNQASEMLPAMKTGQLAVGLLPEPAATKITKMNAAVSRQLDIQAIYGGDYPQAVLVAKKSVLEGDSAFLSALMSALDENAAWIAADDGNAASAVDAVNSRLAEGVPASLDKSVIDKTVVENCNIYLERSAAAKNSVNDYLAAMRGIDDKSAGTLSDAFFATLPQQLTENAAGSYRIAMPDGAPALAMAKLIAEEMNFEREVEYAVVASANIGIEVMQKNADVAVLPVTAASKTIGNGEQYVMLGVVTHGNLYVMSSEKLTSLADLRGKTVGVIGQGQVPDLTLRYLFAENGIEYAVAE
ncbi:MAG: hypothetical protein DBX59_03255 [Bacillota bacterium]|nr:MAG: hypothetical protein DBX59_03255 [Bacillota bacterium]